VPEGPAFCAAVPVLPALPAGLAHHAAQVGLALLRHAGFFGLGFLGFFFALQLLRFSELLAVGLLLALVFFGLLLLLFGLELGQALAFGFFHFLGQPAFLFGLAFARLLQRDVGFARRWCLGTRGRGRRRRGVTCGTGGGGAATCGTAAHNSALMALGRADAPVHHRGQRQDQAQVHQQGQQRRPGRCRLVGAAAASRGQAVPRRPRLRPRPA
jgi:hypothetical protein